MRWRPDDEVADDNGDAQIAPPTGHVDSVAVRSLDGFSDPFLAEIAGQPDAMRRAAAALLDQRDHLDRVREAASVTPTIVFTGMGSSYDACYPAVNDLAGRGVSSLLVDTAELLHFRRPILNAKTLVVIVSQSGESAEIVKLVSAIAKQRLRPFVVSITNSLDNDLARRSDVKLDTWAGREVGPSTMTFAAAMATLSGIARLLAGDSVDTAVDRTRTAAEGAALSMTAIVTATEPETRRLDLGLAADLIDTGANVLVVTPDGEAPKRARAVATGYLDRALISAVSIIPVQLLAWRLAQVRGRTPGQYTRASKVTTRE